MFTYKQIVAVACVATIASLATLTEAAPFLGDVVSAVGGMTSGIPLVGGMVGGPLNAVGNMIPL